ncbi:hypothetical protein HK104_001804 [Borealophlyctis nickersoniae]|nr:hypothetical protein HK104_001804 [Borealophlyctis nickersoniae]
MDDILAHTTKYLPGTSVLRLKLTCCHLNLLISDKTLVKSLALDLHIQHKGACLEVLTRRFEVGLTRPWGDSPPMDLDRRCSRYLDLFRLCLKFGIDNEGSSMPILMHCSSLGRYERYVCQQPRWLECRGPIAIDDPLRVTAGAAVKMLLDYRNVRGWVDTFPIPIAGRQAANCGYLEVMKLLDTAFVLAQGRSMQTLVDAAYNGHTDVVEWLIQKGAMAMSTNRMQNVLTAAARGDHLKVVRLLLDVGTPVIGEGGWCPLDAAIEGKNLEILELLLRNGADIHIENDRPLRSGARCKDVGAVKMLIAYGADVHAQNEGALLEACRSGAAEMVKLLLEYGADMSVASGDLLRYSSSQEVIKALLDEGLSIRGNEGALLAACRRGAAKTVKLLLEYGADMSVANGDLLRYSSSEEVMKILLDEGLSIHEDDDAGLQGAAEDGDGPLVMFLLDRGATVTRDVLLSVSSPEMMRFLYKMAPISDEVTAAKLRAAQVGHTELELLIESRGKTIVYEIARKLDLERHGIRAEDGRSEEEWLEEAVWANDMRTVKLLLKWEVKVTRDTLLCARSPRMMRYLFSNSLVSESVVAEAKLWAAVVGHSDLEQVIECRGKNRVYEVASKLEGRFSHVLP